jgi:hypothetical protein
MLWWLSEDGRVVSTRGFRGTNRYAYLDDGVVIARMQNLDNTATTPYSDTALDRIVQRLLGG